MLFGVSVSRDIFNFNKFLASLAESERLIYSASLVLSAVILCWCERQLIAPPLYINIQPVVDFLVSKSAAKSASAYPYIILCPIIPWIFFPYVIP